MRWNATDDSDDEGVGCAVGGVSDVFFLFPARAEVTPGRSFGHARESKQACWRHLATLRLDFF